MVFRNHDRLWSMKCVLIFVCDVCVAPVKIHCQWVKVYGVCVIPWQQADTVRGFQQWQDRCWHVVTCPPGMSTTDDTWHTDTFSCWHCQRAIHSLGSTQNCLGPTGLHRSVCALGAKEYYRWWQSSLYGNVWAILVFTGHVILIKEGSFGAETWLITQNLKPEKGCVREKLSSSSSKENGSIVISKDDCGKLSWGP